MNLRTILIGLTAATALGASGCRESTPEPEPTRQSEAHTRRDPAPRAALAPDSRFAKVHEQEIFPGVYWMQFKGKTQKGKPAFANVIDFDPEAENLRVQIVAAKGQATYPRESTRRISNRLNALAAINGSYFHFTEKLNGKPIGLVKVAGTVLSPARSDRPSLGFLDNGQAIFGYPLQGVESRSRQVADTIVNDRAHAARALGQPWDAAPYALEGGPLIVIAGEKTLEPKGWGWSIEKGHEPRTAVGKTSSGRMLWVTVDGRRPGHSMGMPLGDLADFFLSLGAEEALNWDGGGSTTMMVKGKMVTKVASDWCRAVSNAVVLLPSDPAE